MKYLERQSPARIIAIGFLAVILTGFSLLMLPVCVKPGVRLHYVDALFTSTSAVCVTGLIAVDTADTYTALGQTVVALLIQIGGLGVTIKGAACNEEPHAFHYRIPQEAFYKAAIVTALSALVVCLGTFFMCILEPAVPFEDILFEITSAFGIVGLSTGITPGLSSLSKLLEVLVMYIGRLGPLTIVTIWVFKPTKSVSYAEGSISIG